MFIFFQFFFKVRVFVLLFQIVVYSDEVIDIWNKSGHKSMLLVYDGDFFFCYPICFFKMFLNQHYFLNISSKIYGTRKIKLQDHK